MIEWIQGKVLDNKGIKLLVQSGPVGLGVQVSLKTSALFQPGMTAELYTYLHVREDALELFGFASVSERDVFLSMISISGVGPKMALRILSETSPAALADHILSGNTLALTKLKGVGKKTAELLVLHLKPVFAKAPVLNESGEAITLPGGETAQEAVLALIALGVKDPAARKAVDTAMKTGTDPRNISLLITEALKHT